MTTACGRENKKKLLHLLLFRIWTWTRNGRVCRRSSPPAWYVWLKKKEKLGDDQAEFWVYWYFFPRLFLMLACAARGRRTPRRHLCRSVGILYARRFFAVRKKNVCVPTTRPTTAVIAWRARHRERSLGHRRLLASTTPSVYNIPARVYTCVNRCSITYRRSPCYVLAYYVRDIIPPPPLPNRHMYLYGVPHLTGGDRLPTTINGEPI